MSNYKIIRDQRAFEFFAGWTQLCSSQETYYFVLVARKKYVPDHLEVKQHMRSDMPLKSFCASTYNEIVRGVRQLEVPLGAYMDRLWEIPQEALVLYCNPNKRDLKKASYHTAQEILKRLHEGNPVGNPRALATSKIHSSKSKDSKQYFVHFDYDVSGVSVNDMFDKLYRHINPEALWLVQTRGGYHALILPSRVSEEYKRTWYQGITEDKEIPIDHSGDFEMPVPGTTQGTFVPQLYWNKQKM